WPPGPRQAGQLSARADGARPSRAARAPQRVRRRRLTTLPPSGGGRDCDHTGLARAMPAGGGQGMGSVVEGRLGWCSRMTSRVWKSKVVRKCSRPPAMLKAGPSDVAAAAVGDIAGDEQGNPPSIQLVQEAIQIRCMRQDLAPVDRPGDMLAGERQ